MRNRIALFTVGFGLSLILSLSQNGYLHAQAMPKTANLTLIAQTNTLTPDILKNTIYHIPDQGSINLTNGTYQSQIGNSLSVTMSDRIAYGDFNGDGIKDAAVLLAVDTGGSGVFKYLAVVTATNGNPVNLDTISLGDRVIVKSLSIKNGKVQVKMLTHSPTDPLCCPSQELTQAYQLQPKTGVLTPTTLAESELNPNAPQVEVLPANPASTGNNTPFEPTVEEFQFRF